ncbi:hypothetical protein ACWDOR_01585 [Streptosporangium canum]
MAEAMICARRAVSMNDREFWPAGLFSGRMDKSYTFGQMAA